MNGVVLLAILAQPLSATVGLGVVGHQEQLSIGTDDSTRTLLGPTVAIGLAYELSTAGPFVVEGASSLSLGLTMSTGRGAFRPAQAVRLVLPVTSWLAFAAGLEGSVWLDTGDATFSFAAVGAPLEVRVGPVALVYVPRLSVPLAAEEAQVLGATRRHRVAFGMQPVAFALRFSFDSPQSSLER